MGWWDRFRKRKPPGTANPSTVSGPVVATTADGVAIDFRLGDGPERPSLPRRDSASGDKRPARALPEPATIAAFNASDGLGFLAMAGDERLAFGASACKGFQPVVGARVIVDAIGPHPLGGWRATSVRRDLADRHYDILLAERDAALGIRPPPSDERSAAIAAEVAQIIVLLDEPLIGPGALAALLAGLPAPAPEFAIEPRGSSITAPERFGRHCFQVFLGASPFPRTAMDLRRVAADFDLGRGFLGIAYDAFGLGAQLRTMTGNDLPSVWGPVGGMRVLARLVQSLRSRMRGVVLPGAGMRVHSADEFVRLTGDLDDPHHVPAWHTLAADPGGDDGEHDTYVARYEAAMNLAFPGATRMFATRAEADFLTRPVTLQFHRERDGRYRIGTAGLSLRPQAGVEPDSEVRFVELLAFCDAATGPALADDSRRALVCRVLTMLAAVVDRGGGPPLQPFDRVATPIPELQLGGFVMGVHGVLTSHDERRIALLAPVPCDPAEYERIAPGEVHVWFDRNPLERLEDRWRRLLSRMR